MFDVNAIRADFPGTTQQVYLNAAGIGLPPRSATQAVQRAATLLGQGPAEMGYPAYYQALGKSAVQARQEAARLLQAQPTEIAFTDDTTMGLNTALAAIPFAPGDNIVLCDLEYPQVAISAAHSRKHQAVEVRVARHRDGLIGVDDYAGLMDQHTRALVVSSVQWINGLRMDLAAFSHLAEERGCFLVVDAIQQLGALPLDVSTLRVDFLAAGAQKWLNAPFNIGLLYIRSAVQEQVEPGLAHGLFALAEPPEGWLRYLGDPGLTPFLSLPLASDARRFEVHGMPKNLGTAGLAESLAYVNQLDSTAVTAHILSLGDFLIEELRRRDIKVWTQEAHALRSGIVTCEPFADADRVHRLNQALEARHIYPTVRYCSGVGGLRVSIHYYTSRDDIEALLAALDEIRKKDGAALTGWIYAPSFSTPRAPCSMSTVRSARPTPGWPVSTARTSASKTWKPASGAALPPRRLWPFPAQKRTGFRGWRKPGGTTWFSRSLPRSVRSPVLKPTFTPCTISLPNRRRGNSIPKPAGR